MSLKETNKYANVIARFQLKNQTGVNDVISSLRGVNDVISSLRGTKQSILVIGRCQLKNQTGVNDLISSLRGTKQSILVIGNPIG